MPGPGPPTRRIGEPDRRRHRPGPDTPDPSTGIRDDHALGDDGSVVGIVGSLDFEPEGAIEAGVICSERAAVAGDPVEDEAADRHRFARPQPVAVDADVRSSTTGQAWADRPTAAVPTRRRLPARAARSAGNDLDRAAPALPLGLAMPRAIARAMPRAMPRRCRCRCRWRWRCRWRHQPTGRDEQAEQENRRRRRHQEPGATGTGCGCPAAWRGRRGGWVGR